MSMLGKRVDALEAKAGGGAHYVWANLGETDDLEA